MTKSIIILHVITVTYILINAFYLLRVREAEKLRQQSVRETINAKEQKMILLQRQRERELLEGRAQAQLTAELRDHLR